MDPNETLGTIRATQDELGMTLFRLAHAAEGDSNDDQIDAGSEVADAAVRLSENVAALDEWLTKGGFPPDPWVEPMKRAAATAAAMAHLVITVEEYHRNVVQKAADSLRQQFSDPQVQMVARELRRRNWRPRVDYACGCGPVGCCPTHHLMRLDEQRAAQLAEHDPLGPPNPAGAELP